MAGSRRDQTIKLATGAPTLIKAPLRAKSATGGSWASPDPHGSRDPQDQPDAILLNSHDFGHIGLHPSPTASSSAALQGKTCPGSTSGPSPHNSRIYRAGNKSAGSGLIPSNLSSGNGPHPLNGVTPAAPGDGLHRKSSTVSDTAAGRGGHLPAINAGHRNSTGSGYPTPAVTSRQNTNNGSCGGGPSAGSGSGGSGASSTVPLPSIGANNSEGPIVVTYAPPRAPPGTKSTLRKVLSRPRQRSNGADQEGAAAVASGDPAPDVGDGGKGFLRGIRRLFGIDSTVAAAAAAAARAAAAAEAAKAEAEARAAAEAEALPVLERSPASILLLTTKHQQEQERMQRLRMSVLAPPPPPPQPAAPAATAGAAEAAAAADAPAAPDAAHKAEASASDADSDGEGGTDVAADAAVQGAAAAAPTPAGGAADAAAGDAGPSSPGAPDTLAPRREPSQIFWDEHPLRTGKSFTQQALEDPNNPFFRSAMALALAREKEKTFTGDRDRNWRDKVPDEVPMERPILTDGWKI